MGNRLKKVLSGLLIVVLILTSITITSFADAHDKSEDHFINLVQEDFIYKKYSSNIIFNKVYDVSKVFDGSKVIGLSITYNVNLNTKTDSVRMESLLNYTYFFKDKYLFATVTDYSKIASSGKAEISVYYDGKLYNKSFKNANHNLVSEIRTIKAKKTEQSMRISSIKSDITTNGNTNCRSVPGCVKWVTYPGHMDGSCQFACEGACDIGGAAITGVVGPAQMAIIVACKAACYAPCYVAGYSLCEKSVWYNVCDY